MVTTYCFESGIFWYYIKEMMGIPLCVSVCWSIRVALSESCRFSHMEAPGTVLQSSCAGRGLTSWLQVTSMGKLAQREDIANFTKNFHCPQGLFHMLQFALCLALIQFSVRPCFCLHSCWLSCLLSSPGEVQWLFNSHHFHVVARILHK